MPSSYAVGEHFERFIKEQVQGGRYASASEVVRDALRLLEEQERTRLATLDVLRDEIRKGLDSGAGKPAEEVFTRLERKYAAKARERRAR
jgi:antitoxin ParD1/3/4